MRPSNFFIGVITILTGAVTASAGITAPLDEVAGKLAKAAAGDTIFVADGTYSDVSLRWKAPGHPVTVCALNPGAVVVTGKSSLRMCGDSLTVSGIDFVDVTMEKGGVVEFKIGDKMANDCRLTDCTLSNCNPERRDIVTSYIILHGRHNRVDHCSLTGKLSLGVTLLVNLNDARSLDNGHRIDHNYFGPRPVYGSNGAETMRIGTSQQSYETSATVVENNFFDGCNGEVEIISVKSSDNVVRKNVFHRCQGVVALRHGRRNLVEDNLFVGNGERNTGGVRVVDAGHRIVGNTFCQLAGKRFFSALAIMNSVPNSLPNRYVQVTDVLIEGNTFIDCSNIEFGTGRDMERTQAPADCIFTKNVVMTDRANPYTFIDADAAIEIKDNVVEPVSDSAIAKVVEKAQSLRGTVGPNRQSKDAGSVTTAADTIHLPGGIQYCSEPIVITRPTVIEGHNTTLRWNGSKGLNFITIANGGSLTVKDVIFDGALQQGCAVVHNAIATQPGMLTPYSLTVENCSFLNMPESGCCAIRGTKGTFADYITVKNCSFADLSGNAISFADETDDKGRYNAEDILISECRFSHMLGIPVNIYRGGSDESTAGPYVTIEKCSFTDCCNRERGSVLRLIGPQVLTVADCLFEGSGRGGASVRLDETTWEDVQISHCRFVDSGRVISNRNVITE